MNLVSKWSILAAILILSYPVAKTYELHNRRLPVFGLLIPAGAEDAIATKLWLRSASEEGVSLETISYDDFTNPFQIGAVESRAILVPDEVSQAASPTLISYLQQYVDQGGKLILVGDALMHDLNGRLKESFPAETYFQFPKVVGRVGDTIQYHRDTVRMTDEWKKKLQIPPGQYSPVDSVQAAFRELCTYQSLHAKYPHWQTETAAFTGEKILEAGDGSLVAGRKKMGNGEVLWINLPLSFLKRRTDGLLMHSFVRYISEEWLGLPRLLSVPNGVGGMVLNLHVDSNAASPYLEILKKQKFFEDGPFSIHVTAGPDTRATKDGLGFDLVSDKKSQEWIHYWLEHGHSVGSHGGWIHDYFGLHIGEKETPEFVNYLEENFDEIKRVAGKPPVEYSAPLGNQPLWVNDWLRKKSYRSYYFVGDNGMGPTQNFRDAEFTDQELWSFPIASYLQVASFEEAADQKIPEKDLTTWLVSLGQYVSDSQNARLFYFHPPGIRFYQESLNALLATGHTLSTAGKFKWYTMDQLATFLTEREDLHWTLHFVNQDHEFELNTPPQKHLTEMVWRLPKSGVKRIYVVSGKVKVQENDKTYLVQAEDENGYTVRYEEVPSAI